jgi:ABC-2 type transport system permease protein
MISHPMHIYPEPLRRFFTYIIPAIFLSYYPALYILDLQDPFNMPKIAPFLSPIVGFGMFFIAYTLWQYGIRHYQSTGT